MLVHPAMADFQSLRQLFKNINSRKLSTMTFATTRCKLRRLTPFAFMTTSAATQAPLHWVSGNQQKPSALPSLSTLICGREGCPSPDACEPGTHVHGGPEPDSQSQTSCGGQRVPSSQEAALFLVSDEINIHCRSSTIAATGFYHSGWGRAEGLESFSFRNSGPEGWALALWCRCGLLRHGFTRPCVYKTKLALVKRPSPAIMIGCESLSMSLGSSCVQQRQ